MLPDFARSALAKVPLLHDAEAPCVHTAIQVALHGIGLRGISRKGMPKT